MSDAALREQLRRLLSWGDAHVTLERAVQGLPERERGLRPRGAPHSPWELLEHLRLTQRDILDFCRDPHYREPAWPEDYWPGDPAPPTPQAWEESIAAFQRDREALAAFVADPGVDLFAAIPWGSGQTCLREVLLAADHTSHHLGQLVLVRRLLGSWPPPS